MATSITVPQAWAAVKAPHREGDGRAGDLLARAIIALSVASNWPLARREWDLVDVYFRREPPGTCLCTHFPIVEHCLLINRKNGSRAVVGNVCVNRFFGLPSEAIFRGLRRIAGDQSKSMGETAVEHAHAHGWLNDWERHFYLDTCCRRRLSPRQLAKRVQINLQVLARASRGEVGNA
jgi:hypothetical protein